MIEIVQPSVEPGARRWEPAPSGPYMAWLGPVWKRQGENGTEYGLVGQEKHANHRNTVHGGVIMAFADYALGCTAIDLSGQDNQVTAQIDLQFVATAAIGSVLIGRGEIVRRTSSLAFIRGTIEAEGKIVASAQGVWKIIKASSV